MMMRSSLQVRFGSTQTAAVCIVGAGPCGLLTSLLLSKLGVDHIVVERRIAPTKHPQAHFINTRSMEILKQALHKDSKDLVALISPVHLWKDFVFGYSILGNEFLRVDNFADSITSKLFWMESPSMVAHLPQHRLEELLRSQFTKRLYPHRQFLEGAEVTSLGNEAGKISVALRGPSTSSIICDYIVATDGSSSVIRNSLRISMEGERTLQTLLNVHFRVQGLDLLKSNKAAMLYFLFNEVSVGVCVAHDIERGEWVCQIPVFPPFQDVQDFDHTRLMKLIWALIGTANSGGADPDGASYKIEILSVNRWIMNAEVAERFTDTLPADVDYPRVFLVGDSAHRFPPAGGFGMNTGLQDAHNLAWKLASVIKGVAKEGLLRSYETERRQIALENTELSMRNFEKSLSVARALGVDPSLAKYVIASTTALPDVLFSTSAKKAAVNLALQTGLAPLRTLRNNVYLDPRMLSLKSLGRRRRLLPLIFPQEDIDFSYKQGAFVGKGREGAVVFTGGGAAGEAGKDDKVKRSMRRLHDEGAAGGSNYSPPVLAVGARLPHCWFQVLEHYYHHQQMPKDELSTPMFISSIDLCLLDENQETTMCSIYILVPEVNMEAWTDTWLSLSRFWPPKIQRAVRFFSIAQSPSPSSCSHHSLQWRMQSPRSPALSPPSSSSSAFASKARTLYDSMHIAPVDPLFPPASNRGFQLVDITGRWTKVVCDNSPKTVAIRPDGHVIYVAPSAQSVGAMSNFITQAMEALHIDCKVIL